MRMVLAMSEQDPSSEPRDQRFSISLTKSELDELEEWMWTSRVRSRSDAARRLIVAGLAAQKQTEPAGG